VLFYRLTVGKQAFDGIREAKTMKETSIRLVILVCVCWGLLATAVESGSPPSSDSILDREFQLAGKRTQETQYFLMESQLITYALDGSRLGTDIFRLRLKCVPAGITGGKGDEYTCARFTLQHGEGPEMEIPALENWVYVLNKAGMDEKGQVFGIDHGKFENLTDGAGIAIPPEIAYHVYNAFIDFHSFCDVFAVSAGEGKGIQDLKKIGQKIVHAAAFSEPPVNLGSNIAEGSYFRNGEITLAFKGLSSVNGRVCALLEYDSGESSFKMIMRPMPNMEIQSVGSSHYRGDIFKDIATNWVQKVTMNEFVVSETTLPVPPNKINSVYERNILIRNVDEKEFSSR
jgi:hypothetical protein